MQLGNNVNPHAEGPRPPERSVEYTSSTYLLVGAKPSLRQTVDRIIARSFVEKGQNQYLGREAGGKISANVRALKGASACGLTALVRYYARLIAFRYRRDAGCLSAAPALPDGPGSRNATDEERTTHRRRLEHCPANRSRGLDHDGADCRDGGEPNPLPTSGIS